MTIILLAVAGVIISVVVGTLWYSPKTPMGKVHMQSIGFAALSASEQEQKMNEMKPRMPKIYGAQMVLSFLTSFATVFIVSMSMQNNVPALMSVAFVLFNWLFFIVPVVGGNILWGNVESAIAWKKFLYDALYHLVILLLIGTLASFFF